MKFNFFLYCYNLDVDNKFYMKDYIFEVEEGFDMMVLDVLILFKE